MKRKSFAEKNLRCGITIIEILVVLGVIAVLMGLLAPALFGARKAAQELTNLSRIRQIGILTTQYADSNDDIPPVLFDPVEIYYYRGDAFQKVDVGGVVLTGAWFNNGGLGLYLLDPPLPQGVAMPQGAPNVGEFIVRGEPASARIGFRLADCLYAMPRYWNPLTQEGIVQWKPQRLSSIAHPSDKGLAKQTMVFGEPDVPDFFMACCSKRVQAAVQWADLSATTEILMDLTPGVPNFYHHGQTAPPPYWAKGPPIDNTLDGVLGRDR